MAEDLFFHLAVWGDDAVLAVAVAVGLIEHCLALLFDLLPEFAEEVVDFFAELFGAYFSHEVSF